MTETNTNAEKFEGWAIVELMGHRQTAGKVMSVSVAGVEMLRVDVPGENSAMVATQYYGGAAIYCLTPCDEATARRALKEAYSLPPPVRLAIDASRRALPAPDDDDEDQHQLAFGGPPPP